MRVVYVEPFKPAVVKNIEPTLKAMQDLVEGYIQVVYPFDDPVALVCNDDGKLTGDFAPNRGLYHNGRLYDMVYGPFFLALARPGAEELESLPDDLIDKYLDMYKEPKI